MVPDLLARESQLTVIADTVSQPGLFLFKNLVNKAISDTKRHVFVICFQMHPKRLIDQKFANANNYTLIDCFTPTTVFPILSGGTSSSSSSNCIQLDPASLGKFVTDSVQKSSQPIDIFLDSANSFTDATSTGDFYKTFKFALRDQQKASAVILYHQDLPNINEIHSISSSSSSAGHSLEYLLTCLTPSSNMLQLRLHSAALLQHLMNAYHLRVDPDAEKDNHDPRVYDYLVRLDKRAWASPFSTTDTNNDNEDDEAKVGIDGLCDGQVKKCVIQWMSRGQQFTTKNNKSRNKPASSSSSSRGGSTSAASAAASNTISKGLQGLILEQNDSETKLFTTCDLSRVVSFDKIPGSTSSTDVITMTSPAPPTNTTSTTSSKPVTTTTESGNNDDKNNIVQELSNDVTFNLTMTDRQREARSQAASASTGTGQVLYIPDAADDVDEEDPDEDLEI